MKLVELTLPGGGSNAGRGLTSREARKASNRAARIALFVLGLIYTWFWIVVAHRITELPSGVATSFVTECGDFEHFYQAARALREGSNIYASGMHGYIYPPLIAFLFAPLTWLSVQDAAQIMLVVNLALGGACTWVFSAEVMRRMSVEQTPSRLLVVMAATTLLSATLLRSEFQMWQTNILVAAALVLALRFLDTRPGIAGLLLGFAFNIKYLPLVFLPYLLIRRRYVAAASFAVGGVAFALMPGLASGWQRNVEHWTQALSGVGRLMGWASPVTSPARVDPITAGHSLSITSGLARLLGDDAAPSAVLTLALCVALAVALMLWRTYAASGRPVLQWPPAGQQASQPYAGMVALEWGALVILILAFSPQTNPRHTSLLVMPFAILASMLCSPGPSASRWPAALGAAFLFCGLNLPPNAPEFVRALSAWRWVGGAGWCMVLALPFYFIAGFRQLAGSAPLVTSTSNCEPPTRVIP